MRQYDLHTHSVHSDGTMTPTELIAEAAGLGIAGIALTDHDTTAGWDEARRAAAEHRVGFLPGIEVTTRDGWHSTHLLGYGLQPEDPELAAELARVRSSRVARASEMVDRLSADFDITWEQVLAAEVGGAAEASGVLTEPLTGPAVSARTVGRPHIADALVNAGYFVDRGAAFASVLRPGSDYYVATYAIETEHAIRMVVAAGGVPVLAHPAAGRHTEAVTAEALARFAAAGLWGIELDHPENRADWVPRLRELAAEHALVVTGSSDYHGAGKVNRMGECTSGEAVWQSIRDAVAVPQ